METTARRQPLILKETIEIKNRKCGEIVGGKTAECAAICCCFPCAILDLLILVTVKLPAGLCMKAIKKRRKRKTRRKQLGGKTKPGLVVIIPDDTAKNGNVNVVSEEEFSACRGEVAATEGEMVEEEKSKEMDEEEMMTTFVNACGGFWRSPSQTDTDTNTAPDTKMDSSVD